MLTVRAGDGSGSHHALVPRELPAQPLALTSWGDCVLQVPLDMWEGKLHHVEFALQAKLKSQTACVIILSHRITMKCHGTIHYMDSENALRPFIFSWPRLSTLPDTICICHAYVGQNQSL